MQDSQEAGPAGPDSRTERTGDQVDANPFALEFLEGGLLLDDPEWYDADEVAAASVFEHKWWQDELEIAEPVLIRETRHRGEPAVDSEEGSYDYSDERLPSDRMEVPGGYAQHGDGTDADAGHEADPLGAPEASPATPGLTLLDLADSNEESSPAETPNPDDPYSAMREAEDDGMPEGTVVEGTAAEGTALGDAAAVQGTPLGEAEAASGSPEATSDDQGASAGADGSATDTPAMPSEDNAVDPDVEGEGSLAGGRTPAEGQPKKRRWGLRRSRSADESTDDASSDQDPSSPERTPSGGPGGPAGESAGESSQGKARGRKLSFRRRPAPADSEPGGADPADSPNDDEQEAEARQRVRLKLPAALTLDAGSKDDPYRPRFAVAPTPVRVAVVLLWASAGACVLGSALCLALALASPGRIPIPTIGSMPSPAAWLFMMLLAFLAFVAILASQGVARGYRNWYLVALGVCLLTLWSPLTSIPCLIALASRHTRDWVV